jgi:hypothetical protein
MRGDRFRRRLDDRRMQADEGFGDMSVNFATFAPQHAFVSGLLNQRVLEAIARIGSDAVDEDEIGVDKLLQRGAQLGFRRAGDRAQ